MAFFADFFALAGPLSLDVFLFVVFRPATFFAGVRFLLARLFCSKAMKSTALVAAFSGTSTEPKDHAH